MVLMIESPVAIIKLALMQVKAQLELGHRTEKNLFEKSLYDYIIGHEKSELLAAEYIDARSRFLKMGITSKLAVAQELGWKIPWQG